MRKLRLLSLSVFMVLSGCRAGHVVVPNTEACTAAGVIAAGAICAETITGATRDMTVDEFFDFLEPKAEPSPNPSNIPSRAGAVCQSSDDWNSQKTALEVSCRILGKNCTYELKQVIKNMSAISERAKSLMLNKQTFTKEEVKEILK